ncbi:HTH domain-containing protein [Clostridium botulinum]|nr:HTH domain-containing protein [Clostridium botulinum]NFL04132.1 HTH domain-containing protein [Clostridium botulinum]
MNRKEFDSLDINEQIKYINKELNNGKSLTELSEKINISRSTIRKRFKKLGYLFDQDANKYLCDKEVKNITSNMETKNIPEDTHSYDNNINTTYGNENIEKLALKTNEILSMLTWWESRDVKNNIDISGLNNYSSKTETRSFNVNKEVLNNFVGYCKDHKEYRQIDLISIALLDFLEKYK